MVFNWPVDTVNAFQQYGDGKYYYKPIDKKSNYVKRCVGVPGDSIEIRDGYVYVNGKRNQLPDRARLQFAYIVRTNAPLSPEMLYNRYDITDQYSYQNGVYLFPGVTEESINLLKNNPNVVEITRFKGEKDEWDASIFPYNRRYPWNNDNMGPIYIPKKGATVSITPETLPFYKRIIEVYEGSEIGINNEVTVNGTEILLNGQPLTSYTFKMDYYWMMGDNRNNSEDARTWGYVPHNHIVGKPVFIWMSWDGVNKKLRWNRLFTTVGGSGEPTSYFLYFIVALILWFAYDAYRKKKKKG